LEESGYVNIEKTYRGKVPRTVVRLSPRGRAAFEAYRKGLNLALVDRLQDIVTPKKNNSSQS
jgi:DNA-binding PadR family transcriptional regulator